MPGSITIHSGLPQSEQNVRLEAFEKGLTATAITVDKFNEGIDVPEIQVVVFLRSTQSDTIFYQQLGRGLRKLPGKKVLVLDFVANCDRIQMIYGLVQAIRKEEAKGKNCRSTSSEESEAHFKGLDFVFTEKAKDILKILEKVRTGFYPTWQEGSRAAQQLRIKTPTEYWRRYKEDPRLPTHLKYLYPDFPGFTKFLTGNDRVDRYRTWQNAAQAAKKIGIKTPTEYRQRYREDPCLYKDLKSKYKDFPGFNAFLGLQPRYKTLKEAEAATRRLGIHTYLEYYSKRRYLEDPRLPSNPRQMYKNFPGWKTFLGKVRYEDWQSASRAAKELGIKSIEQYYVKYKRDPKLFASPQHTYPDFPGWSIFLRGKK